MDRETNKELLLKHIQDNRREGSLLRELVQVLPALSRAEVQNLLRGLRHEGRSHNVGEPRPLAGIRELLRLGLHPKTGNPQKQRNYCAIRRN